MMGINGYQYIEDSLDCMICSNECTSSSCNTGPRILPWTQDYDDGLNCQNENSELCEAETQPPLRWPTEARRGKPKELFLKPTLPKLSVHAWRRQAWTKS